MRVLKIMAEGLVTSFRYPHFVQGVQLTYDMPPPATIYGHICSAVGDYIGRDETHFAYHFTSDAKFFDYEHLHFFGKTPKMNPFERELLFRPRLTLYLTNTDLKRYFLSPYYPVVLGRSQDLMTYISVEEVELERADEAYYANTLLRLEDALQLHGRSYSVTMPRFVDERRIPEWAQYAILHGESVFPATDRFIFEEVDALDIWIDPSEEAAHSYKKMQRGIIWHGWGDDGKD